MHTFNDVFVYCSTGITGLDKLESWANNIGAKVFSAVVTGCYWFFAVITVTDIIKKGKDHDYMGCLKTSIAGALGFGAVQLTRIIMDAIKDAFR